MAPQAASVPARRRPGTLDYCILAAYPITVLLGSLYAALSSTTRNTLYDAQSHTYPTGAPSYFARKENLLNTFFVKVGWAWTTLAFVVGVILPLATDGRSRRMSQALSRYAVATAAWIGVTRWFFGPGLVDRAFAISGGMCELAPQSAASPLLITALSCKTAGGKWTGGHDISGHVFLLCLGSGMLVFEMLGTERREGPETSVVRWGKRILLAVMAVSWWMLFMTAIYFHMWPEKVSGLLLALGTLFVVYILPQEIDGLRAVLGIPGNDT